MLSKIKELEEIALQLEPEAEARQVIRDIVIDYSENFLSELAQANTYVDKESNPEAIIQSAFSEEGRDMADLVEMVRLHVDTPGINPASGGHLGYIPGGGLFPSSLADYLAAVTNRYAGIFYANPGAVRMENMIIQWLNELMGYPKTAAGNLASGGSIANLIAITTARDAHLPHSSQFESAVIYLSGQAHHCLHKALRIAGLGQAILREVPLDDHFRMIPSELESMIQQDKAKGLSPFMIIASAGTTDVGAIDPLDQLADLSAQYQLWFHIDAAYGGFFMLCPEFRPLFKGMERSDSMVIDPHKGLFLPYGIGVVLVRDADKMRASHYYQANYMQDAALHQDEISPTELSPELTKHFRGLRMWMPLKLFGLKPFRAALEEKVWLTRYFHQQLSQRKRFELGPNPQLSVTYFRYLPVSGDVNEFNKKLMEEIHKDGRVFLSSTLLQGQFYIRLAVLCFRTHLSTIDRCLEMIDEKIDLLEKKLQVSS